MAFPVLIEAWNAGSTGANATSWGVPTTQNRTQTIPAGSHLWVCVVSADGNPTLTLTIDGNAATKLGQASNGTIVTGAVFYRVVTNATDWPTNVSPNAQLSSTLSEQFSAQWYVFSLGNELTVVGTSANGSSTNSNPPSEALGGGVAKDVVWLATRSGDSTVQATAAPASYTNLLAQTASGTGGASTASARRQLNAISEDPGTFTSASEQWVSWTVAVYKAGAIPLYRGSAGKTAVYKGIRSDAQLYKGARQLWP